jgi:aerobic carbon-monoxide dehydrogenase large subunit
VAGLDDVQVGGLGASTQNMDNTRFVRGRGNFIEDFKLPTMLFMEVVRSPYAHARIKSIDTEKAAKTKGVHLVLTGRNAAEPSTERGVPVAEAWTRPLSDEAPPAFAIDKVLYAGQEVACVVAENPYIAKDAAAAIEIEYEPLPVVVSPFEALDPGAPLLRDDKPGQTDNVCYRWSAGDAEAVDRAFADAEVVSRLRLHFPRWHPAPVEQRGCLAHYDPVNGKLIVHATNQVPHVMRAAVARMAGMQEHMVRIISPDVGGAFGAKMPVLPGYLIAVFASIRTGRPVRWVEDRSGSLVSPGWGRDVYLEGELALRRDGKMLAVRMRALTDNGAYLGNAQSSSAYDPGLLHAAFACYGVPVTHVAAEGTYTNKAPGSLSNRTSFRLHEAMYFQERLVDIAAADLGIDAAELRRRNLLDDEAFPHRTAQGLLVDSGRYQLCLQTALDAIGYDDFLQAKEEAAARGRRLGIGISTSAHPMGSPGTDYDTLGIKMFESAFLRIHLTGKAILRVGVQNSGQDEEVTLAQVVAHELGIPVGDIFFEQGDTAHTPVGVGAHAGAAVSMASRKVLMKARKIAAHLLEVGEEDVTWERGRFHVRGVPAMGVSIQEIAMAAYGNMPDEMEPGLEYEAYYNAPSHSWPFAVYVVTVEVDPATGDWAVQRVVAVDDVGNRINPAVVTRQIAGGLTEALGLAKLQVFTFDTEGRIANSEHTDYLSPTSWDTPRFELHEVVTPSANHPLGAKVAGETSSIGAPAAFVNAVLNAISDTGVRNIDMPLLPGRVWEAITSGTDISDAPPLLTGG